MSGALLQKFRLDGQLALVTGASSGLGLHFAQVRAQAGARVALAARRVDKLQSLVEDIQRSGGDAMAVGLNVSDIARVGACFDALASAAGAACANRLGASLAVDGAHRVSSL